jgi:hypothetical protein
MRSKKRRHTNRRLTRKHKKRTYKKRTYKNKQIGGAKSSYDDYDYLDGTYKLLLKQYRPQPNMGDYYNTFKSHYLYLYGYKDFIGANKLIPIKEYVGFTNEPIRRIRERIAADMPVYYYMSELVFRHHIITQQYWQHGTQYTHGPVGFLQAGIRGYVSEEDTIIDSSSARIRRSIKPHSQTGVPPRPKVNNSSGTTIVDLTSISSLPYIDKFLYFPHQDYKFVVIKPSRESDIYHTEVGEIMLNEPGGGEKWFDSEVCIIFDEFFIPPPLESQEHTFDTRGVAAEMLAQSMSIPGGAEL